MSKHRDEKNTGDLGVLAGMVEAVRADAPAESVWWDARRNLMGRLEGSREVSVVTRILRGSRSRRIGWAAALGIVVVVVALLIGLNPWARGPGQAFAAVVEQFRSARTMTCTVITQGEGLPTVRAEVAYKEPGHMRQTTIFPFGRNISVFDTTQMRTLVLIPATRQFMEMDYSELLPDLPANRTAISDIEKLRTLPDRANELLGEREMDGRKVLGFLVTEGGTRVTAWVDAETWDVVRVESEWALAPGMRVVMTDFQFNVDLDDSLFSLTPPEGYTRLEYQMDLSTLNEQDLIRLLRSWAEHDKDRLFPPALDYTSLAKGAVKMGFSAKKTDFSAKEMGFLAKVKEYRAAMKEAEQFGAHMTRGMMFLMLIMKPENDWHYAGEGVQLGEALIPICWWRPDGSDTYRVIYGDLSIEDVAPEDVPSAQERQDAE